MMLIMMQKLVRFLEVPNCKYDDDDDDVKAGF
jgi:hypothetical protein